VSACCALLIENYIFKRLYKSLDQLTLNPPVCNLITIRVNMEVKDMFRSKRLLYRAVEDTAADEAFMHTIQSDIVSFASSDTSLLKPMTRAESKKHRDYVKDKTLIGVIICLPPAAPDQEPIPIGSIYLRGPRPGQEHHRNSDISVDIITPYQRKGYGSEAIVWILEWGFRHGGLHRIGIECFSYNEGARRLYEGLGFVFEGRRREVFWYNGGWHDLLSLGMLEGEWRERMEKVKEVDSESRS
jgi:RimJ/RimL family protein N-acetyltransferase